MSFFCSFLLFFELIPFTAVVPVDFEFGRELVLSLLVLLNDIFYTLFSFFVVYPCQPKAIGDFVRVVNMHLECAMEWRVQVVVFKKAVWNSLSPQELL